MQQHNVSFTFGKLNKKVDDKISNVAEVGRGYGQAELTLTDSENTQINQLGRISKRSGYDSLSRVILDTQAPITNCYGSAVLGNDQLLFDGSKIFSYVEDIGQWKVRETFTPTTVETNKVIVDPNNKTLARLASSNNIDCYVYKYSTTCAYAVYHRTTKAKLASGTISTSFTNYDVVVFNSNFYIFYNEAGILKFVTIPVGSPTSISSATILFSDIHSTNRQFELCVANDRIYISYYNASNQLVHCYISNANALTTFSTSSLGSTDKLALVADSNGSIFSMAVSGSTSYLNAWTRVDNPFITNLTGTFTSAVSNVAGIVNGSSVDWYATVPSGNNSSLSSIYKASTDRTTGAGTAAFWCAGVYLAGYPTFISDTRYIVPCIYWLNNEQDKYLFISDQKEVVGRVYDGEATSGDYNAKPKRFAGSSFPVEQETRFEIANGTFSTFTDIARVDISATQTMAKSIELDNHLYIPNGVPRVYDGSEIVEDGFHYAPTILSSSVGPAGSLTSGTYGYVACYEWTDSLGVIHRSSPSTIVNVATGGATNVVTLTITNLQFTKRTNVRLVVYRTTVNGTIFYRVQSQANLNNTPATPATSFPPTHLTFVDTSADSAINTNDFVYTTGEVLEAEPPKSTQINVVWKDRIFYANKNTLYYSKAIVPNEQVQYNSGLSMVFSEEITGLAVLEHKLIIFTKTKIYSLVGDGPTNNGANNDFVRPELEANSIGCINHKSIIVSPLGVMFQSNRNNGIYVFAGGEPSFIGADVDNVLDAGTSAATLIPSSNRIIWTSSTSDKAVVFDWLFQQWHVWTNHDAVAALVVNDKLSICKADGTVWRSNNTKFADGNGSRIKMLIQTGWINTNAIQSFGRLYKIFVLGNWYSNHTLNVSFGYDYKSQYRTVNIDTTDYITSTVYGTDTYGAETPFGGESAVYQFRVDSPIQQCQCFRFKLSDTGDGKDLDLSGITAVVGVSTKARTNQNKIAANNNRS